MQTAILSEVEGSHADCAESGIAKYLIKAAPGELVYEPLLISWVKANLRLKAIR